MRSFFIFLSVMFSFSAFSLWGQSTFNALQWKQNTAYNSYLMRDVHRQYTERSEELTQALHSEKGVLKYRDNVKKRYKSMLGEFPDNHPLNAKVLKVSQQQGFRIEKIIFESVPKRYVTANLYLPEGKGPFPASLELCGHGLAGKLYSAEAVLMALNGIAVLVVDPIGQGERIQLLDDKGKPATRGATTEHTLLNAGCNLVGTSLAALEWWDNHRAIDYLETRADIDKNRLGVYGSSGGGTQTAYLIGAEDRLKVACICSYFSQRERVLELNGPSDGCQHIPGEGEAHIEISDWGIMFAPKPLLIMSGLYDFVDYWGATQGVQELKQVYSMLGARDAILQFTAESGHGMPKEKREALTSWFRKWLCNDSNSVHETQSVTIPDSDQICTKTGQVNTSMPDAESIQAYNTRIAHELSKQRELFLNQPHEILKDKILKLLGVETPSTKIESVPTGKMEFRNYTLRKYQIQRKAEMPIACVVVIPEKISSQGRTVIFLNESGKDNLLNDESTVSNYVNQGDILVVADLRGVGESVDPMSFNDSKYWNHEYRNAMTSLHTGRSIVGQRVIDIFSLLDFVTSEALFRNHPVFMEANGIYGSPAIHATFLDKRIVHTEISNSIKSYIEYIKNPMQYDMFSILIPGVLQHYDLQDLVDKSGKNKIQFKD